LPRKASVFGVGRGKKKGSQKESLSVLIFPGYFCMSIFLVAVNVPAWIV